MKKQEYMKPALQVVKIKHQRHLLSGSAKANGVSGGDFNWKERGFGDTDDDYDR